MDRSITRRGLLFGGLGALGLAATRSLPAGAATTTIRSDGPTPALRVQNDEGLALSVLGRVRLATSGHVTIPANHRSITVRPSFPMDRGMVIATVQNYDSNAAVCAVEVHPDRFEIMLTYTPAVPVPVGWVYFER